VDFPPTGLNKMRLAKAVLLSVLTACFLVTAGAAQEQVEVYLTETTPLILGLQENIENFMGEVQPLREKKDIIGLKDVADNYIVIWDGMLGKLDQIEPGPETEKHYQALKQLFEMQKESNRIMSETLAQRIELLMEIQKMRDDGATDEDVKEFAANNTLDRDALVQRTSAVKAATKEADDTLKTEHKRLTEMVAGDEGGES
jgi:hypothetical protein